MARQLSTSRRLPFLALAGAVVLPAVLAGCSSDTETSTADQASSTTSSVAAPVNSGATVTIDDFAYGPAEITVKANETVTWVNDDGPKHTVTATPEQAIDFKSSTLQTGDTFVQTFSEPGTYSYFCSIHGADRMSGTIVVEG